MVTDRQMYESEVRHSRKLEAENKKLRAALETLTTAVEHMRVPQTVADAALQVMITVGPAVVAARATLSSSNRTK